ncbi:Calcium permeable stress-gated cation channel 1 [Venturia nashicola]|uniref:Calcium permeable stress-gated cation channel 1 n=1 Tax=Venturia nashicola TaxID=86259 RepID=A0A4Z1PDX8_9PEZI|nr:Calcium permeable stress-gated cation channel 1 [Venturia nashicola]
MSLLLTFKAISLTFSLLAITTGLQALLLPTSFSKSFGIPIHTPPPNPINPSYSNPEPLTTDAAVRSYISLMGIRQFTTGLTLLIFASQGKWIEMATILSILGFVVAGTDGIFLWKAGKRGQGIFHALPGALIAILSCAVVLFEG